MAATGAGKTAAPAKAGKAAKKQTYTDLFVARSDGVDWSRKQIIDDMIATAAKDHTDISEPLAETEERNRAWKIKLGKCVKYNLGTNKTDREPHPPGADETTGTNGV